MFDMNLSNLSPAETWNKIVGPRSTEEFFDGLTSRGSYIQELDFLAGCPFLHPNDRPSVSERGIIVNKLLTHIMNNILEETVQTKI